MVDDMDDIIVATHRWRNTWGATKEASVVGRLSSCCLAINIISFFYLFCCFCFSVSESWPTKAQVHVTGGFCSYITMTIICLFSAASLSRSFSLMRKNWPKKALVRVIGEEFCYYITMTTIYFFQLLLFLLWGKTDQKRRWSRWSGRGCVGRTPRHSGVSPERREKGRVCRIERNWRRYERQIKLQSRVSSSDAKCWCHTL